MQRLAAHRQFLRSYPAQWVTKSCLTISSSWRSSSLYTGLRQVFSRLVMLNSLILAYKVQSIEISRQRIVCAFSGSTYAWCSFLSSMTTLFPCGPLGEDTGPIPLSWVMHGNASQLTFPGITYVLQGNGPMGKLKRIRIRRVSQHESV